MSEQQILNKLDKIEKEILEIRNRMIDADTVLSEEEREILDKSVEQEKKGNLISLDDMKNVRRKAR